MSEVQFRASRGSDRRLFLSAFLALIVTGACGSAPSGAAEGRRPAARRPRPDLYRCEGCEGALERNPAALRAHAAIAPAGEAGERLLIEGLVLGSDGRTPAPNVVIYAYHTDAAGRYSRGSGPTEAGRRHGLLRGWVRTGSDGRYSFDTIKPAPYPGERVPAHVHLTVLEPGRRPYWIDDIVFEGEFGVTPAYRRAREDRGGSGIVRLSREGGRLVARRNVILEPHP
jgi:protocatechuate 3,4-dioxygenase beta subunit